MPHFRYSCKSDNQIISFYWQMPAPESQDVASSTISMEEDQQGKLSSSDNSKYSNYQNLPYHLKSCFDYCVFRCSEPKKTLVRLLLAEGLIQEKPEETMEETAANVIRELAGLGMLREEELLRLYIRTYTKIHEPYHRMCIVQAGEEEFISKAADSPIHAIIWRDNGNHSPLDFKGLPIRSLFLHHKNPSPADLKTVCGLKFLSTLELDDWMVEYLPDEIGDLVHLRYLRLIALRLKELPSTLGNLLNLQTLVIHWCQSSLKLPVQILRIVSLRHLIKSGNSLYWNGNDELRVPFGIGALVNLQTCYGVYPSGGIATELRALTQLREFGAKRVSEDHVTELLAAIARMEKLVSLSLQAEYTLFQGTRLMLFPALEPFSPPPLLQELHLYGGLMDMPNWIASMENLSTLTLSRSKLSDNPNLVLQFLPNLKHLTLHQAYTAKIIGEEFCGSGGFPKLETLYIESEFLVGWTEIVNGAFSSLKWLGFRSCLNFKLFPEGLQNVSTLRTLSFQGLKANQDLIRRLKGEENYKIKHIPSFEVPNYWSSSTT